MIFYYVYIHYRLFVMGWLCSTMANFFIRWLRVRIMQRKNKYNTEVYVSTAVPAHPSSIDTMVWIDKVHLQELIEKSEKYDKIEKYTVHPI